ncbi:hypothetical protein J5J83_17920 [Azoarcus sp. L1K30]|uniref:hypothetical protein n=1 Tax=Azoarcus sp. L1K30 TaxID=2820277 RepID=UPI001B81AF7E|nr:hypothetical protein [Azoarcus sp. L1K30]MBR0568003.1 hypothetical protein [Azoarcus sp. L1K30]
MMVFVTFDHLHSFPGTGVRPGLCHKGARALCERYGMDWAAIVKAGGVSSAVLIETGDALAISLVEHAMKSVVA